MPNSRLNSVTLAQVTFLLLVLIGGAVAFALIFNGIDTSDNSLGIDNIFYAFKDWDIHYDVVNGLRNPPWSVLPLIPLGQIPLQAAWGVWVYATLIISVLSVPLLRDKRRYFFAVLFLVVSFPSLRNIADAQLEAILFGGACLLVSGYQRKNPVWLAFGVLFVTVKPQASFILLPVLALYVLQTWPAREWLKAAGIVALFVVPTFLWRGGPWLDAVGGTYQADSLIDISLSAAIHRMGNVPEVVVWILSALILLVALGVAWKSQRTFDREKAAMLIVTSMLLAPYVAGNSVLTVLAVGLIPLYIATPRPGLVLIALINLPFLFLGNRQILIDYQSYWWTFILLVSWIAFNWRIVRREIAPSV